MLTLALLFGFAAFLFTALPPEVAGATLRRAFPQFYLFVLASAGVAAALAWPSDRFAAGLLAVIVLTTLPTRQMLMPAINRATDAGAKSRFQVLHGLSVAITLAHIGLAGFFLSRFVDGPPA
jgi:hypothetical protein